MTTITAKGRQANDQYSNQVTTRCYKCKELGHVTIVTKYLVCMVCPNDHHWALDIGE